MNASLETSTKPRTRSEEFKAALGEHYYRAELICYSSLLVLGGAQIIIREQFPNVKPPWPIIVIPVMTILIAFVVVPPLLLIVRLRNTPSDEALLPTNSSIASLPSNAAPRGLLATTLVC
jgi:hypothetical protein